MGSGLELYAIRSVPLWSCQERPVLQNEVVHSLKQKGGICMVQEPVKDDTEGSQMSES